MPELSLELLRRRFAAALQFGLLRFVSGWLLVHSTDHLDQVLIERGSDIKILLVGGKIEFLIDHSIKTLESYEVMSLLAPILNKYVRLAGRQMSLIRQIHDHVRFCRASRTNH